jgi:hypothetical protein
MSVEIRNLPTNANALTQADFVPVDPAAVTTTSKNTVGNIVSVGFGNVSSGTDSRTEGQNNTSSATASHAEGQGTTANAANAHSEGNATVASATSAHAEGTSTIASATAAHAEGNDTTASGLASHAQNISSIAAGDYSTAISVGSTASNYGEFAIGVNNLASPVGFSGYGFIGYFTKTVDATAGVELFLDGTTATQRFLINNNTMYQVNVEICGFSTAGTVYFTGIGVIKNVSGTVSTLAAITMSQIASDGTLNTTSATAAADNVNKSLKLTVTGVAATNINWIGKAVYMAVSSS